MSQQKAKLRYSQDSGAGNNSGDNEVDDNIAFADYYQAKQLSLATRQLDKLQSIRRQIKGLAFPAIPTRLPQSPRVGLFSASSGVGKRRVVAFNKKYAEPVLKDSMDLNDSGFKKEPVEPLSARKSPKFNVWKSNTIDYTSKLIMQKVKTNIKKQLLVPSVLKSASHLDTLPNFPLNDTETKTAEKFYTPETGKSLAPLQQPFQKSWDKTYTLFCQYVKYSMPKLSPRVVDKCIYSKRLKANLNKMLSHKP